LNLFSSNPLFQLSFFLIQNKFPILISVVFFLSMSYIAFFHHLYFSEGDGIYYLINGRTIVNSNLENITILGAPIGGSLLFGYLENLLGDGFSIMKGISVISGTSIVFLTYFITKNIFGSKIALFSQIFVAINPKLQYLSWSALNELLPLSLIAFSFFFLTKKELRISHLVIIGILIGLAFMIRYQFIFIFIGIIIFLLIRDKKIRLNLIHCTIIFAIFLVTISPLLLLNYYTFGDVNQVDSGYYFLILFEYQTPEWRETVQGMQNEGLLSLITADPDLFFKNYFYNLLSNNPNRIFNFGLLDNLSILPPIPIIGFITVSIGFIAYIKPSKDRRILYPFLISGLIALMIFLVGDINSHYFALLFFPLVFFGIFYHNKISRNFLPLLIILLVFFFALSILPVYRSYHFLVLLIPFSILNSIFLVNVLGRITSKKNLSEKSL
jgi:4-amino-4-deoxy-L-arabinose transferase-like glycosyltransferase